MTRKFLEDMGLEKEAVDKIMAENGSDIENARNSEKGKFDTERTTLQGQITELQGQVTQRDTDLTDLQGKLQAAQADAGKLGEVQQTLSTLQTQYASDKQAWEQKNAKQAYEFAVKTAAAELKFSSAAAQRDFVRGAIEKGMQMEGDKILGFGDYVESYKTADPGAFVTETPPAPTGKEKPDIVLPPSGAQPAPDDKGFNFHFNGVRPMPKE